ncbi:hypothetical protein [Pseudoxanthomonas putridarboris]|uniref:Uncharacterized protein n=1 Tax=Pseudoxanthomonas putridarboris TaxID=752605 RepID=A0ABU9J502_9GAMM
MSIQQFRLPPRSLLLAGSLALTGIVAFSIHVWMLAVGVPVPLSQPPVWARWLDSSLVAGAVLVFLKLAHLRIGHLGVLTRTLIAAGILMAIQETLRARIMSGVVTAAWTASALGLVRSLASSVAGKSADRASRPHDGAAKGLCRFCEFVGRGGFR